MLIKDRPTVLLAQDGYISKFPDSIGVDLATIPELVNFSLLTLGGVQPITAPMAEAAGGETTDQLSESEIEYFRKTKEEFQHIQVVLNLVRGPEKDGVVSGYPYAVTLVPSSKRGKLTTSSIDFVAKIGVPGMFKESAYRQFNPFTGEWTFWSQFRNFAGQGDVYFDEIGLVLDYFFLSTKHDPSDILYLGDPTVPDIKRFNKKRNRVLFTAFKEPGARRVWGVESPIELFLLQQLNTLDLTPQIQMLFTQKGEAFPTLYDAYEALPDGVDGILTEADFYFERQNVAVFCDGAHHRRRKQRERDVRIDERLAEFGITVIRVTGTEIMDDLKAAAQKVHDVVR